ncbi:hypothetical protein [Arenicella xantha]|uniref:Uncharacterized protein n=1 Tax=Arenicella xantha TaxID=644221 RepID=A0A395JLC5_9GAMM|nr:hypothetical protein [Arenicella xantha]RBP51225.1 hypothetical protein DFR28_102644 [Arenicella xantha]
MKTTAKNLNILVLLCTLSSPTLSQTINEIGVQELQEFRPGWASIPSLQQPSFAYGEVNNSKLLAEAGENLNYLTSNNLIVGNTRGYQVVGPNGEVFYVDNIDKPKCAVVAQYIETAGDSLQINQSASVVSNVYIEQVDFQDCY